MRLPLYIRVFQCYTSYRFSVAFRHIYLFTASSSGRFFCFITLTTFLSLFISGLPLLLLPSGYQVNIRFGHLLSPLRNSTLYHFNVLFFQSCLCYSHFLQLLTFLMFLCSSKNQFLYFTNCLVCYSIYCRKIIILKALDIAESNITICLFLSFYKDK